MYNKKVLSTAVKNLNKAKAPKQPKDIITDPEGQWKFPGQITRIPGNDITMAGVNYPVLGVSDTGQEMMMYPGMNYTFPGANYVDEYPQMKKGGLVKLPNKSKKGSKSKAYSRSLEATNKLFAENPLFKKSKSRKSKIYDPNAKYYQDGGATSPEEWEQEIRAVERQIGNPADWTMDDYYLLQDKLNAYRNWRETTPEGQAVVDYHNEEGEYDVPLPEHLQDYTNAMMKARLAYADMHGNSAAKRMINIPDNPYDFGNGMTGTHYMSSMGNYAVPQIQNVNGQLTLGDFDPSSNEAIKFDNPNDARYFAEHYKEVSPGFIEAELTPEEIEEYAKGGYIIEDISVPELTKAQKGKIVTPIYTNDPNDLRLAAYRDSLWLYYNNLQPPQLKPFKTYSGPSGNSKVYPYKVKQISLSHPKGDSRPTLMQAVDNNNNYMNYYEHHSINNPQYKSPYFRKGVPANKPIKYEYKEARFKPNAMYNPITGNSTTFYFPWEDSKDDNVTTSSENARFKKPVQPVKYVGKNKLDERYIGTPMLINYPKAKPVVQEDNSITPLKPKGFDNINTPEKLEMPVFPPAQPKKDIRTASRLQTVMEPDTNNPGRYKVKELRSVPYSAYFEGEGWQPLTAPGIVWIDEQGNEVSTDPRKVQGPTASFQRGGIKKYQIAGEVTTPVETAPAETDEVVPVYTNPVYSDVMKWLNENPIYVAPDKPLSINEYEQINTQNMYPKMSGKLLYIPKAGYFNEQQYKVVKEFPVEGGDPIRIYEVVGGEGRKKYIVDDRGFNKEFFSLYQEPKGRTREIYPVYGRGLPYRKYGGILSKMQDGGNFYTLKGSKGVYRKVGNKWEVDWNRTGNFQPLSKGDVKERTANLNKNAQPLYDRDYTTMMGVKSEAPVPQNPFTTNFVNQFGITDQAIANASAVAPTVENAQKLERLTQQKAYEDALRQRQAAARQRENELLEQSKFTNVPLSQVSDATQMYTDDVERQAIAGAPAAREARKRQAEFEKQQWEKYNKMSTFERIMDRTKGFMVDPLGMTSRALMGEQGYIPGMGEGLLNKDDPNYYKYLVAAGYTPGEFDMFDVQSMVNPMYWGASMGNNINRGNYLDAGIEAALTFAPMVPKGTISQGARMLGDDVSRGVNYLTTKTPLKNAYKINPWAFKPNSEAYYRMIGQEGYADALESRLLRSNPGKDGLQTQQFDDIYFSMKHPWDGRNYGYVTKSGEPIGGVGYKGPYMAELTGQELNHPISSFPRANMAQSKVPISLENPGLKLYKQHWLKGYKEVPKQLPGSPNVPNTIQLNDVGNVNMTSGFSNAIPAQKITNPLSRTYRIVDDKIRSAIENFKSIYKEPNIEDIEKKIIRKRNIKNVTQQDAEKVFNEQMQERLNFYNTAEGKERIERFLKDNQLQGLVTPDEFIERMSNVKYFNANEQQLVQKQYNQLMNNYYELQGQIKNRLNKKNEIELLLDNTLENDSDKWWDLATELENIDKELENIYKVSDQTLEQVNNLPNVSKDVAYYSPSKNKVFIGNDYIKEPSTLKVTGIHEGGHAANFEPYLAIQEKYPTAQINWENLGADIKINQDLKNPALFDFEDIRDLPEHLKSFDNKSLLKSASSVSPLAQERYKNPLKYIQNEYEYFMSKDEASSFLAELIPLLQERGHIKNFGDYIEPQMVADIFDYYRKNSSKLTMEPYRILDIMKPTAKTIQNLANKLNDLHVIAPVIGTTAGAVLYNQSNNQSKEPQQFDKGGIVSELSKKEINDLVAQGYIIEDAD